MRLPATAILAQCLEWLPRRRPTSAPAIAQPLPRAVRAPVPPRSARCPICQVGDLHVIDSRIVPMSGEPGYLKQTLQCDVCQHKRVTQARN